LEIPFIFKGLATHSLDSLFFKAPLFVAIEENIE
jgi:hypothetical protein